MKIESSSSENSIIICSKHFKPDETSCLDSLISLISNIFYTILKALSWFFCFDEEERPSASSTSLEPLRVSILSGNQILPSSPLTQDPLTLQVWKTRAQNPEKWQKEVLKQKNILKISENELANENDIASWGALLLHLIILDNSLSTKAKKELIQDTCNQHEINFSLRGSRVQGSPGDTLLQALLKRLEKAPVFEDPTDIFIAARFLVLQGADKENFSEVFLRSMRFYTDIYFKLPKKIFSLAACYKFLELILPSLDIEAHKSDLSSLFSFALDQNQPALAKLILQKISGDLQLINLNNDPHPFEDQLKAKFKDPHWNTIVKPHLFCLDAQVGKLEEVIKENDEDAALQYIENLTQLLKSHSPFPLDNFKAAVDLPRILLSNITLNTAFQPIAGKLLDSAFRQHPADLLNYIESTSGKYHDPLSTYFRKYYFLKMPLSHLNMLGWRGLITTPSLWKSALEGYNQQNFKVFNSHGPKNNPVYFDEKSSLNDLRTQLYKLIDLANISISQKQSLRILLTNQKVS